jgi:hypothetical protein
MGYAPEDVMCMAVEPKKGKPLWRNTKVTVKEIRTVFQWEPCLICVLAKRRKEGTMKWKTLKKNKRRKLRLSEEDEKKQYPTRDSFRMGESGGDSFRMGESAEEDACTCVEARARTICK